MHIRIRKKLPISLTPINTELAPGTPSRLAHSLPASCRIPGDEIGVLMVGINEYSNSSMNLFQCVRDIQRIRKLFMDAYGIPAKNIQALYNSEATKKNIVEKANWLVSNFRYRSYVHSGHGYRVWNRDEDKYEEGLVVYNHTWSRAGMLLDADLRQLLGAPERTWLIIDACHAGGLSKNVATKKMRTKAIIAPSAGVRLGKITVRSKDIVGLFACQDDQSAYETGAGGVFSTNFVNILLHKPEMTYQELLEELDSRIFHSQDPTIVAPNMSEGLFCIGENL